EALGRSGAAPKDAAEAGTPFGLVPDRVAGGASLAKYGLTVGEAMALPDGDARKNRRSPDGRGAQRPGQRRRCPSRSRHSLDMSRLAAAPQEQPQGDGRETEDRPLAADRSGAAAAAV